MLTDPHHPAESRRYSLQFLLLFVYAGGALLGVLIQWTVRPPPSSDHGGWFEMPWMIRLTLGAVVYDTLTIALIFAAPFCYCLLLAHLLMRTPRLLSAALFAFLVTTTLVLLFRPGCPSFLYGAGRRAVGLLLAMVLGCIVEAYTRRLWRQHWPTIVCTTVITVAIWFFILVVLAFAT